MTRIVAASLLSGLLFAMTSPYLFSWRSAGFDGVDHYLVVTVDGDEEWKRQHDFWVDWQGAKVRLPAMFKIESSSQTVRVGAGSEIERKLHFGDIELPVRCEPATDYRVANEPAAILQEPSGNGPRGIRMILRSGWLYVRKVGRERQVLRNGTSKSTTLRLKHSSGTCLLNANS